MVNRHEYSSGKLAMRKCVLGWPRCGLVHMSA